MKPIEIKIDEDQRVRLYIRGKRGTLIVTGGLDGEGFPTVDIAKSSDTCRMYAQEYLDGALPAETTLDLRSNSQLLVSLFAAPKEEKAKKK